ncbi:MAG: cadmium-translocating P-type ATPase [Candidatus Melainabacteria bacterium]|nr:MAG: cadmium-translocating P-type ATPase [Candidatus Melainabacteria bacterium]
MCEHHHDCHEEENEFSPQKAVIVLLLFISGVFLKPELLKIGFFLIAYLVASGDVLLKACKNIIKGKVFDENFLMSIATIGALAIGEYPEAVMVMFLYQIGEFLQDKAVEKSKNSISSLMNLRPDYANVYKNDVISKKSPEEVNIGDIIVVKTGEKVALDGTITDGEAYIDTSALTGESYPRKVQTGDEILSGCVVDNGYIKIKVSKSFGESTVSKILELVENAGAKKANTENFITRFAKIYTPIVVICALLLAVLPPLLFHADFSVWFSRALTFLVISCPCALVISVPLGFFAGIGGASKVGILIKGSKYLEALSKVGTAVFDKTGTLTKGKFEVVKINSTDGTAENEILKLAATAENYSNHPIATSIKEAYKGNIDTEKVSDISEISGKGIKVQIEDSEILIGNDRLMSEFAIEYPKTSDIGTVIYVAKNQQVAGFIVLADKIKDNSKQAISILKKLAIQTVILSGDDQDVVNNVSFTLKTDKAFGKLMPADKVEKLEQLISNSKKNKTVLFAGDGINDAPVLRRADIGVAMGAMGSDSAIEAADVIIMDDNPLKIVTGISISKKTMTIVKQNITFAIFIKLLFLILGAFGIMTMWGAVFADVGVTLIAVANSLRALKN